MARTFTIPVVNFVPNPTLTSVTPELAPKGTIQELSKASHANGDTLTFSDGVASDVVFEYRVTAGSVTAGHIKVDVSGATTAEQCAAILEPLLLANLPHLSSATDNGTGLITVVDSAPDQANPYTISASNVSETVTGMAAPTGTKTWGYKLVGVDSAGATSAASAQVTTTAGGSALGPLNLNRLAWTDPAGAVSIKIYRTADGASSTPTTTGLIGTVAAGVQTFDDPGLAGDSTTAPSSNTTGVGAAVEVSPLRDMTAQITGTFTATGHFEGRIDRISTWTVIQSLQDASNLASDISAPCLAGIQAGMLSLIRFVQTAYTSGTVNVALGGHDER